MTFDKHDLFLSIYNLRKKLHMHKNEWSDPLTIHPDIRERQLRSPSVPK